MAVKNQNFRRLLATFQTLAELGTELTSEADFPDRARSILRMVMDAVDAREGALFVLRDRPALLAAAAWSGFSSFPERGAIPLLPRHVHALTAARDPQVLSSKSWESFLSANGNIAPELFKCL